jgi:hypothetical protein
MGFFSLPFYKKLGFWVEEYVIRHMVDSLYITLLTYGTFYNKGFVKGLLMIAVLLVVSPIYKVSFVAFFNCLIIRRMNFGQNTLNC